MRKTRVSRSATPILRLLIAFALLSAGALLYAGIAQAFGRREKPPVIVHGDRAFEKPYRAPFRAEAWQVLKTKIDDDLTAVWAVDKDHAWAAGISGGLYRTTDGGETWAPLVGVDFAQFDQLLWRSPDRGFALTKAGEILRSDDGGAEWKTLRFRTGNRVRHIDFVDAEMGWAVGEKGLILRTGNGGRTWERQQGGTASDLTHIQMLSAKTAWAGGPGTLIGTRDGGAHWSPLQEAAGWRFVSGRRGYASDGRAIYRTKDGGEHWKLVRTVDALMRRAKVDTRARIGDARAGSGDLEWEGSGDPFIVNARFVDRYNGIAEVMRNGVQLLFRTRSLGRVWKLVYEAGRNQKSELVSFSMSDGKNGLAIDAGGNLRATADGARTWPVQLPGEDFDLMDVHFADRKRGWAAGGAGRILVTDDGGNHWREAARRLDTALRRIDTATLPSGRARAWIGGDKGRIAASSLEGRPWQSSWRIQATPARGRIYDLDFMDERRGVAVGERGLVIVTDDGGAHWRRGAAAVGETLRAAVYASENLLLVAGGGTLLLSRDGARSFSQIPPRGVLGAGSIVSVDASDSTHLFALQREGYLLRSADGGETWVRGRIDEQVRLSKIQFLNSSRGWVLGRRAEGGSVLYLTDDGGATWHAVSLPGIAARNFHFIDAKYGWLAAPQAILHSVDGGRNWRRQRLAPSRFIRAFTLFSRSGAWAVGDNGFAARYLPGKGQLSHQGE